MKKLWIFAMILICGIVLVGCSSKKDFRECLSEVTKVYYQGVTGQVEGSISVGQREEPYKIDGKSQKLEDFSLFILDFNQQMEDETIDVKLSVNGVESDFQLFLNPVNHYYMNDLGYSLGQNDEVILTYQDIVVNFYNVSDSFNIDWSEALDIAEENLNLQSLYKDGDFKGECYLKILTEQNDNFQDLFWYFSAVSENGDVMDIVISTDAGEIFVS